MTPFAENLTAATIAGMTSGEGLPLVLIALDTYVVVDRSERCGVRPAGGGGGRGLPPRPLLAGGEARAVATRIGETYHAADRRVSRVGADTKAGGANIDGRLRSRRPPSGWSAGEEQ